MSASVMPSLRSAPMTDAARAFTMLAAAAALADCARTPSEMRAISGAYVTEPDPLTLIVGGCGVSATAGDALVPNAIAAASASNGCRFISKPSHLPSCARPTVDREGRPLHP